LDTVVAKRPGLVSLAKAGKVCGEGRGIRDLALKRKAPLNRIRETAK